MIAAGALLLAVVVLGWAAPLPLARLRHISAPGAELAWWLSLAIATVVSAGAGAVMLLMGDRSHIGQASWQACWAFLGHPHIHPADEFTGATVLVILCLAAVRATVLVKQRLLSQQRVHRAHLTAARVRALSQTGGVLWLEHDSPFAYSIAGRPGLVVASTAVRDLPEAHRDAVLRHEHHHLASRHHWLVMAADALMAALPRIPLLRTTAAQTRVLTELSADDSAARECGTDAVAAALLSMRTPEHGRARRLQNRPPRKPQPARIMLAVLGGSLAPAVLGGTILGALIFAAC
ncbi:M56 family metallopeptidase [Catelliglobosispora koreensis]|uniref:M56 family metallopeptidase n=1 Tax=Catelliglobosispora koreensis TaxID=129052 RepID=UPI000362C435|nr:M56 family metallopeptidase [Catelliglobosispora koreensis]